MPWNDSPPSPPPFSLSSPLAHQPLPSLCPDHRPLPEALTDWEQVCWRDGTQGATPPTFFQKFSKVRALVHLLYKVTVESTFQNLCLVGVPRLFRFAFRLSLGAAVLLRLQPENVPAEHFFCNVFLLDFDLLWALPSCFVCSLKMLLVSVFFQIFFFCFWRCRLAAFAA
jgi:hypothetical protein